MKKKLSNSELEVLDLLNEINETSQTSTLEQISSNSKRILEKEKNNSKAESTGLVSASDVVVDEETSTENAEPVPDADVVTDEETLTENAELISDADVTEEDTAIILESKFNILKSTNTAKCTSGQHNDNTVKSFATLRVKDGKATEWIKMCETCLIDFLKLAQRCYVDDNFTIIKSQNDDSIKMSISIVTNDSECSFCPKGHIQRYRIKLKKKSFVICRSCLFNLINKIVSFLYYNSSNEVIESIVQVFKENNIPFKNIYKFKPYRNKKRNANEKNNSLGQKTVSEVNDKQATNEPAIPDDISLEEAKKLLLEYQKVIIKKNNSIENLTEAITKREQTIKDLKNNNKLVSNKSNNRRDTIRHLIHSNEKLKERITKLSISNTDLAEQLQKKETTINELNKQLSTQEYTLEYALNTADVIIKKLYQNKKISAVNKLPLLDYSKSKNVKISALEMIQTVKELIRLIK